MTEREKLAQELLNALDEVGFGGPFRSDVVLRFFDKLLPVSMINRKLNCPRCGPKRRKSYAGFVAKLDRESRKKRGGKHG